MGRRWKSLSFWLKVSGSALILILTISFLFFKEESSLNQGSVFDKSQYLFGGEKAPLLAYDLNVLEGVFIESYGPPFLVSGKSLATLTGFEKSNEIKEYIVEEGDNLSSIAEKFEISLETVLWANNLSYNSIISPKDKLIILPVSGIAHIVGEGDTLSEIAQIYKGKTDEIIEINQLDEAANIYVGDILIIPGGEKPKIVQKYVNVPLAGNYFICPIASPCRITQGLHWFNAVDFSNGKCGEPVFAAAGGVIQRTGYGSVSGYYTRILHPNGVVTFYGHLAKAVVGAGQTVHQGQILGYIGHSGVTVPSGSAGCHLHFDVRFAKNPFSGYLEGTQLGK